MLKFMYSREGKIHQTESSSLCLKKGLKPLTDIEILKAYKCFVLLVWLFICFLKDGKNFLLTSRIVKFSEYEVHIKTTELQRR